MTWYACALQQGAASLRLKSCASQQQLRLQRQGPSQAPIKVGS